MKKMIYTTLLATLFLSGCNGKSEMEVLGEQGTTITVELLQSKTSLGELIDGKRALYWSAGDRIVANGEISDEVKIMAENLSVATFSFAKTLGYPRNIFYPASLYNEATKVTLLRVQDYAEGTVATNTLPMATVVEKVGDATKLHHLAAVVHLQLKASATESYDNVLRKVEIRGRNNEQMSGEFLIDYNTTTLTSTVSYPPVVEGVKESNYADEVPALVTGSRVEGVLSADEVTDVFVVVPARLYERGFTVRVINECGHYMDKEKRSGVTLSKGEIYKLPEIEYVPTGTLMNVEL